MIERRTSHTRLLPCLLSVWLTIFCIPAYAEDTTTQTTKLGGAVFDLSGKPDKGQTVYLLNVERGMLVTMDEVDTLPNFQTKTGAEGQYQFELLHEPLFHPGASGSENWKPGWGEYYLVIKPAEGHAGYISPRIFFYDSARMQRERQFTDPRVDPRDRMWLDSDTSNFDLAITEGATLHGRAFDLEGRPIGGKDIMIWHDLHANTHTGYGAELNKRKTRTDASGRFAFEHVFPTQIQLQCGGPGYIWYRTRLGDSGVWQDDIVDQFDLRDHQYIELACTDDLLHRLRGTVRDEAENPIAGAEITAGTSNHREPHTYSDYHGVVSGKTDAAGHFELKLARPFIRFLSVTMDGYEPAGLIAADDGILEQLEHIIIMKKESNGAS